LLLLGVVGRLVAARNVGLVEVTEVGENDADELECERSSLFACVGVTISDGLWDVWSLVEPVVEAR
jgi:hypothetical protein